VANLPRTFKLLLLGLSLLHLVTFAFSVGAQLLGSKGLLFADGTPVGGDFINMWTTARLVLSGDIAAIYDPDAFMAFQQTLVPADIGLRLWAYPPQTLLLFWPLGYFGFYAALAVWSVLGLLVLGFGARRFGFDWLETATILISPAALACLYFGQTGSFATGLLLLALSARARTDRLSILAAVLLAIKPQTGFLLPVLWAVQRRWAMIAWVAAGALLFCGIGLLLFGPQAWRDYLGITLPVLNKLEREGSGPFMMMIPSAFIAFRILLGNGGLAANLHLVFAALVGGFLIWRLLKTGDRTAQNALLLCGTTLITPYLHSYDLALLLCGAVLVMRLHPQSLPVAVLAVIAWSLPETVLLLNGFGLPLSPLLILPLLLIAGFAPERRIRPLT
jgi:alpha-1,2-mannosyltransferase